MCCACACCAASNSETKTICFVFVENLMIRRKLTSSTSRSRDCRCFGPCSLSIERAYENKLVKKARAFENADWPACFTDVEKASSHNYKRSTVPPLPPAPPHATCSNARPARCAERQRQVQRAVQVQEEHRKRRAFGIHSVQVIKHYITSCF